MVFAEKARQGKVGSAHGAGFTLQYALDYRGGSLLVDGREQGSLIRGAGSGRALGCLVCYKGVPSGTVFDIFRN